jgi:2,3-dihydroxybenzoate-AMP ligase
MPVKFNHWPAETAAYYRAAGYWTDEPLTQMLIDRASSQPDQMAVISAGCSLTYAQLHQQSGRLAQQFLLRGLQPGDTALVQLPNIAEFYLVYFALLKAGIVPVNALFSHNKAELNEYVRQIKPQLAILSGQHTLFSQPDYLSTLLPNSTIQQLVFVDDVDASVFAAANQQVPLTYLHTLLAADNADIALPELNASEVAFFQLSGGSTGTPKLIPRTHNDYLYSVRGSVEICQVTAETRYLCALPCAHNFPMSSPGALGVFYAGGTVVMAPDPSPAACFPLIEKHQITMSGLVPTALNLWLAEAADTQFDISSLQVLQVGGASLPLIIARQVKPKLGCQLQQVFGMAEGLVNYTRLDDDEWTICHTQGRPISVDDEIRIVDEEDNPVPCGEVGSLLTRGPYTIRGYYQSDEHNQRAFTPDGFYRSGDRVRQTEQGCLIVSGREKDQINRGGEKIAAEEIESWLLKHTSIKQVALVAMNDAVMGERACAFVVCHDAPVKAVALRKFLREQGLADYKIPDKFEFVPDLPLTAVGKINKAKLRVLLAEQQQNAMVVES